VIVYADTTIALPLLTSYVLARRHPRPRKRLYDRREELIRTLRETYYARGRAGEGAAAKK
jgi:deoxyhypusine synthase